MSKLELALKNLARFQSLELAQNYAMRLKSWPSVLLGDDGKFWVPSTLAESVILEKAGYELA